ncbi:hypothetical protein FG386_003285 [Cryptosporidium ryanae]|uniref:uncharacterized protein n=1 Tax=Cryptosporidium ryanae TaxID=515981 RepID=UPI00351A50FF|nr:hypothetical protein FG386_003285 [Cryptosporidium ryanae]
MRMNELTYGSKNKVGRDVLYTVKNEFIPPIERAYNKFHPLLRKELFESPENANSSKYFKIQDPLQLVTVEDKSNNTIANNSSYVHRKCIVGNINTQDVLVGELFGMCSKEEMINKQQTSTANDFERLSGFSLADDIEARIVNQYLAVKSFQRSDASRVFHKELVRPVTWCRMVVRRLIVYFIEADRQAFSYLYYKNVGFNNYRYIDIYNFLRDRLRAVWQDLTVQHANRHRGSIECYEISFRFLLLSEECLCNVKEFNSVQNGSLMSTCLGKLMSGYQDVEYSKKRFNELMDSLEFMNILVYDSPYQAEFWSYRILTSMSINFKNENSSDTRIIDVINSLNPKFSDNPLIKLALGIHCSFRLLNIVRYFRYFRKCINIIDTLMGSDKSKIKNNLFKKYSHSLILICILIKKYSNIIRFKYLSILISSSMGRKQSMPLMDFIEIFGIYIESIDYFKLFIERFGIHVYRKDNINVSIFSNENGTSGVEYSSITDLMKYLQERNWNNCYLVSFRDCLNPSSFDSLNVLSSLSFPSEVLLSLFSRIQRIDILDPINEVLSRRDFEIKSTKCDNNFGRNDVSDTNNDVYSSFKESLSAGNRNIHAKDNTSETSLIRGMNNIDINKYKNGVVGMINGSNKQAYINDINTIKKDQNNNNINNNIDINSGNINISMNGGVNSINNGLEIHRFSQDLECENLSINKNGFTMNNEYSTTGKRNKRSIDHVEKYYSGGTNSFENSIVYKNTGLASENNISDNLNYRESDFLIYNGNKKRMFINKIESTNDVLAGNGDLSKVILGGMNHGDKDDTDILNDVISGANGEVFVGEKIITTNTGKNRFGGVLNTKKINRDILNEDTVAKNDVDEEIKLIRDEDEVLVNSFSASEDDFKINEIEKQIYSDSLIEDNLVGIGNWKKYKSMFNYKQIVKIKKSELNKTDSDVNYKSFTACDSVDINYNSRNFYLNTVISSLDLPYYKNGINVFLEDSLKGILKEIRSDIISNILDSLNFSFVFFYNQFLSLNGISRSHINSLNSFYTKLELMLSNVTKESEDVYFRCDSDEFAFPWNSIVVESEKASRCGKNDKQKVIVDLYEKDFIFNDENFNYIYGSFHDNLSFNNNIDKEYFCKSVPIHVEMLSVWMNYNNNCLRNRLFSEDDICTINENIKRERENNIGITFENIFSDYITNNGDVVVWTLPFLVSNYDSYSESVLENEDYLTRSLSSFTFNISTANGRQMILDEFLNCCGILNIQKYPRKEVKLKIPILKTITLVFSFVMHVQTEKFDSIKDDQFVISNEINIAEKRLSEIVYCEHLDTNEELVIASKSDSILTNLYSDTIKDIAKAKSIISHYSGMSCNFKFKCVGLAPSGLIGAEEVTHSEYNNIVIYAPGVSSLINTKLSFGSYSNNIKILSHARGGGKSRGSKNVNKSNANRNCFSHQVVPHIEPISGEDIVNKVNLSSFVKRVDMMTFVLTLLLKNLQVMDNEKGSESKHGRDVSEYEDIIEREEREANMKISVGPGMKYDYLFSLFKCSIIRGFIDCFRLFTNGNIDWILVSGEFNYSDIKGIVAWIYHVYLHVIAFFDEFESNKAKYTNGVNDECNFYPNGNCFISDIGMLKSDSFLKNTAIELLNLYFNWISTIFKNWKYSDLEIPSIIWNVLFDYIQPVNDISSVKKDCVKSNLIHNQKYQIMTESYCFNPIFESIKNYLVRFYVEHSKAKDKSKCDSKSTYIGNSLIEDPSDKFINYIDKELLNYKAFNYINKYKLDNF